MAGASISAMSDTTAPPGEDTPVQAVSIVRLHGEACWHCGATLGELFAAGHITLPGQDRVWPVVVCAKHREAP